MLQDAYATTNGPAGEATALSVLLLRVGASWLALPTHVCREVADMRVLHTLPHRAGRLALGLVNIRGELQLCLRLSQFLGLEQGPEVAVLANHTTYPRLVVIEYEAERWVLLVDELAGVERCPISTLPEGTAMLAPTMRAVTSGCLIWHETPVLCLDPERLCAALRREMV